METMMRDHTINDELASGPVDRDVGLDREAIMREWDRARKWIADGDRTSLPRDWFESVLDQYDERLDRLRAENEALRALLRECRPVVMTYSPSGKPFDFPRELVDRIDAALTPNAPFSGPGANE